MKIHLSLCLSLGLCTLAATGTRADDNDRPITPPHDPDINSPAYDGSTFNSEQSKKPTAAEILAAREARQEEASWLVRGYEQQIKMESTAKDETDLFDPDMQVLSNKDRTGPTSTTSPGPADITSLHAATDPLKDGPTLRPDPFQTSSRQKLQPMLGDGFKPLITPLSATDVAGLPNFYATLPAGTPAPAPASTSTSTSGAVPPATDTPPVTEMPGLTATQSRLTQGNWNDDFTPEPFPDDSHHQQAADSENKSGSALPQIPSGDAARQLQHTVQIAITGKTTPQPAPVKVVIPPDPELTPQPVTAPTFMAGRQQIQDPNDFR